MALNPEFKKRMFPNVSEKRKELDEFVRLCGQNECQEKFRQTGLEFTPKPETVTGFQVNNVDIILRNNTAITGPEWSNKFTTGSQPFGSEQFPKWVIIYSSHEIGIAAQAISEIKKFSNRLGFGVVPEPIREEVKNLANFRYDANKLAGVKFAVVVLAKKGDENYATIKRSLHWEAGIVSQFFTIESVARPVNMANVTMQIQSKLGAELWRVNLQGIFKKVLIMGITMQPVKTQAHAVKIGMSAYLHENKWWSWGTVIDKKELSDTLAAGFIGALKFFFDKLGGVNPEGVIIYREGASDGEIGKVFKHEIPMYKQKLKEVFPHITNTIPLNIINVNKKHNFRFFGQDNQNVPYGTVVDEKITTHEKMQFYLVTSMPTQGTANPTRFTVLFSEFPSFKIDHWITLSFQLCHLYYNFSGVVRLPAPLMYANKLIKFLDAAGKSTAPRSLCDRLHFL